MAERRLLMQRTGEQSMIRFNAFTFRGSASRAIEARPRVPRGELGCPAPESVPAVHDRSGDESTPTPRRVLRCPPPRIVPHLPAGRAAPIAIGIRALSGRDNRCRSASRARRWSALRGRQRGCDTRTDAGVEVFHEPSGDVLWRAGGWVGRRAQESGTCSSIRPQPTGLAPNTRCCGNPLSLCCGRRLTFPMPSRMTSEGARTLEERG